MKKDKYGNNISFSDQILSDMTVKGILGKWTEYICSDVKCALYKYYMKIRNIDWGDKSFVVRRFMDSADRIRFLTPVLEDMTNENLYGMEDIFIGVYGIGSDEVYIIRDFFRLLDKMDKWDEDFMWLDCRNDNRMRRILVDFGGGMVEVEV